MFGFSVASLDDGALSGDGSTTRAPFLCTLLINSCPVVSCIDSGASVDVLDSRVAQRLRLPLRPSSVCLRAANGGPLHLRGSAIVEVRLPCCRPFRVLAQVADDLPFDFIMGFPTAQAQRFVLFCREKRIMQLSASELPALQIHEQDSFSFDLGEAFAVLERRDVSVPVSASTSSPACEFASLVGAPDSLVVCPTGSSSTSACTSDASPCVDSSTCLPLMSDLNACRSDARPAPSDVSFPELDVFSLLALTQPAEESDASLPAVLLDRTFEIPPHSFVDLPCRSRATGSGTVLPCTDDSLFDVIPCFVDSVPDSPFSVRFLNTLSFPTVIRRNQVVGRFLSTSLVTDLLPESSAACISSVLAQPSSPDSDSMAVSDTSTVTSHSDKATFLAGFNFDGSAFRDHHRVEVCDLLWEFRDCFSASDWDLGCFRSYEHEVHLSDYTPFHRSTFRLSPEQRDAADAYAMKLVSAGLARESRSKHLSPLLLIRKKGGGYRVVLDLRLLNSRVIDPVCFSLPRTDDLFMYLSNSRYFSILDLTMSYMQVRLRPSDSPLVAFQTPTGRIFEMLRVPLGLKDGGFSLVAALARYVFYDIPYSSLIPFVDDCCLHSSSLDGMISLLRLVFTRMRSEGIKIQPKKIRLACEVVDFLGFRISAAGICPIPEKVHAMARIATPVSVKQVKSIVSALSFYRVFVPSFSTLAEPLNRLLRKGVPFVWGPDRASALARIREILSSAPVLIHPPLGPDSVFGLRCFGVWWWCGSLFFDRRG